MSAEALAQQQIAAGRRRGGGQGAAPKRLPGPEGEKYRVGKMLGQGAFGQVFQAMKEGTSEQVAVKQIPIKVDDDRHQEKIMREISLLIELEHPNVLTVMEYIVDADSEMVYIITELVEGGSLLQHMRTYGTYKEVLAAGLVAQVLEGLHYMHQNGVIHRDVKAANLMADKTGKIVIGDFGLAKELYAGGEEHSTVGTPHWLAPEAIEGSRWHPTSDIWSLGCTVVELLTGRPPNAAANPYSAMYKACKEPFDAGVPEALSADGRSFLERCFVKRPEDRATARELLQHPWITANLAAAPPKLYKKEVVGVGMGEAEATASAQRAEAGAGSFRQEVSAELLCPVLQRPLHDALSLSPCGHDVSEEAWRGHGSMTCPVCNDAVDQTAPHHLVRKLVGAVSSAVPPPSVSLGGSSGYFPSPAVSEPTELCPKGSSLLATMDEMSLDAPAC